MTLPAIPDIERWATMPFMLQMANIGSEVGRTSKWMLKGRKDMAESAFIRALDLMDLTIKCGRLGTPGRAPMLKELLRSRDMFADAFLSEDTATLSWLDSYYSAFARACRR